MLKHLLALQKTILPEKNYIKSIFPDFFVLDQPGDTAGGDFYKFYQKGGVSAHLYFYETMLRLRF